MKSELLINNNIIFNKFTYKSSDYYKSDIIYNYIKINNIKNKILIREIKKKKKKELFNDLCICIKNLNKYNTEYITIIQSNFRRYLVHKIFKLRGPGVYKKSNNEDDFYYSTNKREIGINYYFSYNDESNNIWMFDIRSINKLILNDIKCINPYTTLEIPQYVKRNVLLLILYLKKNNIDVDIEHDKLEKDTDTKINDIIGLLTSNGYHIEKEWINNLSIIRLKKLYQSFQDMWYYRIQLTNYDRFCVVNERLFTKSYRYVNCIRNIDDIKKLLFDDVYKLINTTNNEYKTLASMWCILSFGTIIDECLMYNQWINNVL
tara:strand:+ start:1033 stop:1989 length:957 start_codon:yes stop_codon:yes gene_type:complete